MDEHRWRALPSQNSAGRGHRRGGQGLEPLAWSVLQNSWALFAVDRYLFVSACALVRPTSIMSLEQVSAVEGQALPAVLETMELPPSWVFE